MIGLYLDKGKLERKFQMRLTIEGNQKEIKNVLQAIGSSKEHEKKVTGVVKVNQGKMKKALDCFYQDSKDASDSYQKTMTEYEYNKLKSFKATLDISAGKNESAEVCHTLDELKKQVNSELDYNVKSVEIKKQG